jgi:predicted acylesterase/phospholipase RssA
LAAILEELELKEHVDEIWGTSAGAIVGAGWATGNDAKEIFRLVKTLNKVALLFDVSWSQLILSPFRWRLPDGFFRGRSFAKAIDRGLLVRTFDECKIPFRCVACFDDGSMRKKIFDDGPLLPAIYASMSLPGIMLPFHPFNGERIGFYDGGLVEKTPIESPIAAHFRSGDPRHLVIIATHFGNEAKKVPARGFLSRFIHALYTLEDQVWGFQGKGIQQHQGVTVLLLTVEPGDRQLFGFREVPSNYLKAREGYAQQLTNAEILKCLGSA